ncbi:Sulfotransferase domain protein [Mariniblastus fucicola]|uniref:Sulfotransferase domain protein n=2 Tax=Mariniblastus fucicola TaxID=980251 RepID=A0A5B9P5V1_9BACT|nr:Sulfotransferase domain protein [Mariniblastus fucicola]
MFFDDRYSKGLDWYNRHFQHCDKGKICGEIAPTYFHSSLARERLWRLSPDLKIIIMVRNPMERTFSLYRHHHSKGRIRSSFANALRTHPELVETGKYSVHARCWEERFDESQFLYLRQREIQSQPQNVLDQVCDFVGVSRLKMPAIASEKVNSAEAPRNIYAARLLSASATVLRSMALHKLVNFGRSLGLKKVYAGGKPVDRPTAEEMRKLAELFEPDILWLEERLGCSLDSWRNKYLVKEQESDSAQSAYL